jgi:hypothetical protein
MVRAEGLEPPHLSTTGPKPAASTNSATRADAVGGAAYNRRGRLGKAKRRQPTVLRGVRPSGEPPCNSPNPKSRRPGRRPRPPSRRSPANRPSPRRASRRTRRISTCLRRHLRAPVLRRGRSRQWVRCSGKAIVCYAAGQCRAGTNLMFRYVSATFRSRSSFQRVARPLNVAGTIPLSTFCTGS